jgi:hypothetical protein
MQPDSSKAEEVLAAESPAAFLPTLSPRSSSGFLIMCSGVHVPYDGGGQKNKVDHIRFDTILHLPTRVDLIHVFQAGMRRICFRGDRILKGNGRDYCPKKPGSIWTNAAISGERMFIKHTL